MRSCSRPTPTAGDAFRPFLTVPSISRYSTFRYLHSAVRIQVPFQAWHGASLLAENFENPRCQTRATRFLSRKLDAYVRPFRPPTFDSCLHLRCILAGSVYWLIHTHSTEGR